MGSVPGPKSRKVGYRPTCVQMLASSAAISQPLLLLPIITTFFPAYFNRCSADLDMSWLYRFTVQIHENNAHSEVVVLLLLLLLLLYLVLKLTERNFYNIASNLLNICIIQIKIWHKHVCETPMHCLLSLINRN